MKRHKNILILVATTCYLSSCGLSKPAENEQIKAESTEQANQTDTFQFKETPFRLNDIVSRIRTIDVVQAEYVGFGATESDNYKNFLALKNVATENDLLQLTDNKNPTVACYAAMALVDKSYFDLKAIFVKFLNKDRQVNTFRGCIKSVDHISNELYHHYWNKVDDSLKGNDKILIQLDSVILYRNNVFWLLTTRALENRVYDEPYKTQIASLAFEKVNNDAIYYLCNWHKSEYADKLKSALLKHLKVTRFSKTGTTDYYKTVEQLFSFKDERIKREIIVKMKKDRHWEAEEERFKYILEDNHIYNIDSE